MKQAPLNKNRQDKFILVLNLPEGIKEITDNINRNTNRINANSLEISITGTVTPSIIVPEKVIPYGAQSIKVSSHTRSPYSEFDFNFKIDNEYSNYWAIYKWLDVINDVQLGTVNEDEIIKYSNPSQLLSVYSSNLTVYGLDEYENRKIQWDYVGAFPTALSQIQWDYNNTDEIVAGATFSFTRLESKLI
tara:strand:+ start:730 stop:1299 length:570 start_codon:yes stop_codon:yes gene_type:complete